MKTFTIRWMMASLVVASAAAFALAQDEPARNGVDRDHGPSTFAPKAALEILHAQPFRIEEPYRFLWCKEQPQITKGMVVVVRVQKELAFPKDTAMPVVYVGDRPAEQTNVGYPSGCLVLIVPGDVDLAKARIFHGAPALPEEIDAAAGRAQLSAAVRAGVRPAPREQVEQALTRGGAPFVAHDINGVYSKLVADLIEKYSPDETDAVENYRMWKTPR